MKARHSLFIFCWLAIIVACLILFTALTGCSSNETSRVEADSDSLYQVSTYGALSRGLFDGVVDFATLRQKGDFGLGTLNGLDGEMVALDGEYYQIRTDGKAYAINDSSLTPFADVTFFDNGVEANPPEGLDYIGLQSFMNGILPSKNIFYAIKIEGEFSYVKVRSVPAQSKPYPALSEAIKNQTVFEYNNVSGVMVGFWCPSYTGSVCVPAYHLHFITDDRQAGGHVLDLRLGTVTITRDDTPDLQVQLPSSEDFNNLNLESGAGE
jgi:acetolactate decarboxylase